MNIFDLLHEDHENVSTIFKKIPSMHGKDTAQTHEQLFKELATELELHAEVEEDIVYPFLRDRPETGPIVEESLLEHQEIETLLYELKALRPDDQNWMTRLKELHDKVEHHVREEEGRLFPAARKFTSNDQAEQLAETVQTTKAELRGQRSGYKAAC
jgi:hemerythrin superfamily protein